MSRVSRRADKKRRKRRKGNNQGDRNRRFASGALLLNTPYGTGTIPTPKIVRALRIESRKIARKIIPGWNGRNKRE